MRSFIAGLFICVGLSLFAQPQIDTAFRVQISKPLFSEGKGPKILVDEAHNNLHKKDGGLFAFSRMMERDGATVLANKKKFSAAALQDTDLLIIVNAMHDSNVQNWQNPSPSAFTRKEIAALEEYVKNGGSLLLVADHMPLGGSVQELASSFGVKWSNSFAMQNGNPWPPSEFTRSDRTLLSSPVTDSSEFSRRVMSIASFTGSAFKAPDSATPFMVFDESHALLYPEVAWSFSKKTKNESASGWLQGACMTYGQGRIVLLGEAAMITTQIRGKTKIGMNSPDAPENAQLALNIFRYLVTN